MKTYADSVAEFAALTRVERRRTAEWIAWSSMKTRCTNPRSKPFSEYGGRGIRVCASWLASFYNFIADLGPRPSPKHSLDRIDVNGHYEPTNVRWATRLEQAQNTRRNRLVTFRGESLCASEWARRLGIGTSTLTFRLKHWPLDRALTAAPEHRGARVRSGGHAPAI